MNPSRRSLIQRRKPRRKTPFGNPFGTCHPGRPLQSPSEYATCSQSPTEKPFRSHPEALPKAPSKPPSKPLRTFLQSTPCVPKASPKASFKTPSEHAIPKDLLRNPSEHA